MFQVNAPAIGLFIAAIAVIAAFILCAWYSAYKRNVTSELWEVLESMIRHPLFLGPAGIAFGAAWMQQWEVLFGTCVSYIGLKFAAAEYLTLKSGNHEYQFFERGWLNTWASAIISTKTIFALATVLTLWTVAYMGKFDATIVGERILEIVIAWGGANGIVWVSSLKGKDMSFLNPVQAKKPVVIQEPTPYVPVALPDIAGSPSVILMPISTPKSPEVPFSDKDKEAILALSKASAEVNVGARPDTENVFYEMLKYAQDLIRFPALTMSRVRDGLSFILQFGKQAYYEQAGHPYGEADKHLADKNPQCPYTSVLQMARAEGYEDTLMQIGHLEDYLFCLEWAGARGMDLIAKVPNDKQSILGVSMIAKEVYRQNKD